MNVANSAFSKNVTQRGNVAKSLVSLHSLHHLEYLCFDNNIKAYRSPKKINILLHHGLLDFLFL